MHAESSGTWVDVPEAPPAAGVVDVQLLAVRFVDSGHPEKKLGTRYRVWVRSNGTTDITTPFNVVALASRDGKLVDGLPQAGVRMESIKPGEVQPVDIRLPFEVNEMGRDALGQPIPFAHLHILVDSHKDLPDADRTNNGTDLARSEVLPVDPTIFSTDVDTAEAGGMVAVAGEGLGPEPGQVVVHIKDLDLEAEIHGWYDLGVYVQLPTLPLTGPTDAELVVIRGDGTASNAIKVSVAPKGTVALPPPEEP